MFVLVFKSVLVFVFMFVFLPLTTYQLANISDTFFDMMSPFHQEAGFQEGDKQTTDRRTLQLID